MHQYIKGFLWWMIWIIIKETIVVWVYKIQYLGLQDLVFRYTGWRLGFLNSYLYNYRGFSLAFLLYIVHIPESIGIESFFYY